MSYLLSNFMEIIDSDIFENWAKDLYDICRNEYNETSIYIGIKPKMINWGEHKYYFIISQDELYLNILFKYELCKYITCDDYNITRKSYCNDFNECYKILRQKLKSFDLLLYPASFKWTEKDIDCKGKPYKIDVIFGCED